MLIASVQTFDLLPIPTVKERFRFMKGLESSSLSNVHVRKKGNCVCVVVGGNVCPRSHTHTHSRTHARTHTPKHACTHRRARAHTHTHSQARMHTQTRARARARTHAHTHTHTHTHSLKQPLWAFKTDPHNPKRFKLNPAFTSPSHYAAHNSWTQTASF